MIYSFHHFYYWMKGGVETGMAYRARIFRELGLEAKFVFATTFPDDNIQHETEYLGFLDSEVMWMYGFYTDCKLSPVTYTLERLENSFGEKVYTFSREGKVATYVFPEKKCLYIVYLTDEMGDRVHRVEIVSNGCLIRKDYYTYCRIYSQYYTPVGNQAHLYLRRFFNEDGSVAYEEVMDNEADVDDMVLYKFPDRLFYSKEELVGDMLSRLNLTEEDIVIIDGEKGKIEHAAFIENAYPAKVGMMIHAEHFLESDEERVLWYGIYEYAFSHPEKMSFYITNTEVQRNLLKEQFWKYKGLEPLVAAIPVVGLDEIKIPASGRKKHSLISAGRLMWEKQMDKVIEAVVEAKKKVPDLTLDIYGEGRDRGKLERLIEDLNCGDYVRLCGFQKLDDVYQNYDAYISASWIETLGVTLLEAVGAGLPVIGFDVPYGTQIFIDEGENGYKLPWGDIHGLAEGIVRLFTEVDLESFRQHSYEKAKSYSTEEVKRRWKKLLEQMK